MGLEGADALQEGTWILKHAPEWAIAVLPYPVWSATDIVGAVMDGTISGYSCSVHLPRYNKAGTDLLPPKALYRYRVLSHRPRLGPIWAYPPGWSFEQPQAIGVKQLALLFEQLPDQNYDGYSYSEDYNRAVRTVTLEASDWKARLLDWLAVLNGSVPVNIPQPEGLIWVDDNPVGDPWYDGHWPTNPVTKSIWEQAIGHASDHDQAPIALVMLNHSAQLFFEGDYRRCVIDAATAFERALEIALSHTLVSRLGDTKAQALLRRNRLVSQRLRLARDHGVQFPTRLI